MDRAAFRQVAQSWARDKKISTAKREKIIEATRVSLSRNSRLREARRKSLSSCSETSSMSDVAPSPDPPMPEYAPFGRESSISPPDAQFTARAPIPEPPPREMFPPARDRPLRSTSTPCRREMFPPRPQRSLPLSPRMWDLMPPSGHPFSMPPRLVATMIRL